MRVFFSSLLFLFAYNSVIFAQDSSLVKNDKKVWINFGLGISSFQSSHVFGPAANFELSFKKENALYSCRFVHNTEVSLFDDPAETIWDLGLLYGKIIKGSYGSASISGGLSLIGGVRKGDVIKGGGSGFISLNSSYESKHFYNIGLPIEAQMFWIPTTFLGVGVNGFANFNPEKSFYGATLILQLGDLK